MQAGLRPSVLIATITGMDTVCSCIFAQKGAWRQGGKGGEREQDGSDQVPQGCYMLAEESG